MRSRLVALAAFVAIPLLPFPALAEERIDVVFASVTVSDDEAEARFRHALSAAVEQANRRLEADVFGLQTGGTRRSGARIEVTAVANATERLISFSTNTDDGSAFSYTLFAPWDDLLEHVLEGTLRYMHRARRGFPAETDETPALVAELSGAYVDAPSAQFSQLGIYPYSLAVLPGGNLVIGGSTFALEVDPLFRTVEYPGSSLLQQGVFNYAFNVAATPGGTLFFKGSTGSEVYGLLPGSPRPQRRRVTSSAAGAFTALPDGSLVMVDHSERRAVRTVDRRRVELELYTHPNAYISAIASGNAGNLWAFDAVDRRILVVSPEGEIIDTIVVQVPPEDAAGTVGIAVYEDGPFLLLSRTGLWKLRRDGRLVWHLPSVPNYEQATFHTAAGVAVDSERGFIYVADPVRRTVSRFMEAEGAVRGGPHHRLARAATAAATGEGEVAALRETARIYEELGAPMMAEASWQRVLDIDPFDEEATVGLERVELARLESRADRLAADTRRLLAELGPESARLSYTRAIQAYEHILSRDPAHSRADAAMRNLRADYEGYGLPDSGGPGGLEITDVEVEDLFPSLSSAYLERPVGHAIVRNATDTALENVVVELELRRFGDYPFSAEPIRELGPGESARVDLYVVLNTAVFDLEEDLPVQLRISARARSGTERLSVSRTEAVTLYRRTALTWDETEKLAAFVTPNEGNVSEFAFTVLSGPQVPPPDDQDAGLADRARLESFSRRISRAARLADALGLYGVLYVEDPQTPISTVLGKTTVVDTVRFPRTTLLHRAGDCDDTTALLCSLYESAGIPTAFVTTPDHVLMAFDTGEPASRRWLFELEGRVVFSYEGSLWIPVETTVLSEGFAAAWHSASTRTRQAGGPRNAGFVPLSEARSRYPPLSVPRTELHILPPAPQARAHAGRRTASLLLDDLYQTAAAREQERAAAASGARRLRSLNRLAMLQARFGYRDEAQRTLEDALAEEPGSAMTRVNLANLALLTDDLTRARRILEPAYNAMPESVVINALLASIERRLGNDSKAARHADLVISRDPELARRYSIGGEWSETRASGASGRLPPIWATGPGDI